MEDASIKEEKVKRTRARYQDRICISKEAFKKVEGWIEQANTKKQALNISPKAIVNWLIESAPEDLNNNQLKDLAGRFYDEVKFLQTALSQMKQAKARGERMSLQDLLQVQAAAVKRGKKTGEPKSRKNKTNRESLDQNPEVLDVASLDPKES